MVEAPESIEPRFHVICWPDTLAPEASKTELIRTGKVSTTMTGLRVQSPVLVTVMVKVTSVDGAPEVGFAVFVTLIPGVSAVTSAVSVSETSSP